MRHFHFKVLSHFDRMSFHGDMHESSFLSTAIWNRDCIRSSKFKRSNRDSTKLGRDVSDIRRACAVRDLGNGGWLAAALLRSLYPASLRAPRGFPPPGPVLSL